MEIELPAGWVRGARRVDGANQDARPAGVSPRLIVVHGISLPPGNFDRDLVAALFCNRLAPEADPYFAEIAPLRVSAHVLVDRAGELTQFVPFAARAWHAGVSSWFGEPACNDFSVGIELSGTDDCAYTDAQYTALAALVRGLRRAYPAIGPQDIVGHCDIAPGRKTDPGPSFEWMRLFELL